MVLCALNTKYSMHRVPIRMLLSAEQAAQNAPDKSLTDFAAYGRSDRAPGGTGGGAGGTGAG